MGVADLDNEYTAKMEDILKLFEKAGNPAYPVVCLDERPVSLQAEIRPARSAPTTKHGSER